MAATASAKDSGERPIGGSFYARLEAGQPTARPSRGEEGPLRQRTATLFWRRLDAGLPPMDSGEDMSTGKPMDLVSRLAAADRTVEAPAMPRVAPLLALATSPTLHRVLPRRLADLLGEARGVMLWHTRPHVREEARATMETILGGTERAHEAGALARRRVLDSQALRMMFWQPPRRASMDERSTANLAAALSSGRGILLSSCHMGPFWDVAAPLVGAGPRVYLVSGDWFFGVPGADYAGRRLAYWWRRVAGRKFHLILASKSYATIRAVLERGDVALLFFDLPGSRETVFLRKPVSLATGTARLAVDANALVLPARARRDGGGARVDIGAALDPDDFADADQLHEALARIHTDSILELSETLEDPRREVAWQHGASGEAWVSPHQPQAPRSS